MANPLQVKVKKILKVSLGNGGRGYQQRNAVASSFWPCYMGQPKDRDGGDWQMGEVEAKVVCKKGPFLITATRNDETAVAEQHSHMIFHLIKYSLSNVNSDPN